MNRSLPHLLLALALLLLPVFPGARAQDTAKQESRRAALQKEIAQLEQQIKENAARSNSALGELTLVRSQIAAHRNLVEESEREIARISDTIAVRQAAADRLQIPICSPAATSARLPAVTSICGTFPAR